MEQEKKAGNVESVTLEQVPMEERKSWADVAMIQAGIMICVPSLMLGGILAESMRCFWKTGLIKTDLCTVHDLHDWLVCSTEWCVRIRVFQSDRNWYRGKDPDSGINSCVGRDHAGHSSIWNQCPGQTEQDCHSCTCDRYCDRMCGSNSAP